MREAREPGIQNDARYVALDSGAALSARPGMTCCSSFSTIVARCFVELRFPATCLGKPCASSIGRRGGGEPNRHIFGFPVSIRRLHKKVTMAAHRGRMEIGRRLLLASALVALAAPAS